MLAESIVFELCRSGGLDENLKVVNAALRERRDALVDALREHIPEAEFVVPEGGYFLWLDLNDDVDTEALLAEAKEEGVTFVAGPRLHDRGRLIEPAPLVRPGPGGRRRRGRPAPRSRARAPAGGGESRLDARWELQLGRELPGRPFELRRSRAASSRSATRFPNRKGRL